MIRETDLAVRVDGLGVKICANSDKASAGYVDHEDLLQLIELLDSILEKWTGKPMAPSTYRLEKYGHG